MLTVCTWLWGEKFGAEHVRKLQAGIARHLRKEHQFRLFRPLPEDEHLARLPGCLPRLRMFDPVWQRAHGLIERFVCFDLDTVITGELDPLFDRREPFVIMQGANAANPCPYNGALMMIEPGTHPEVWQKFSLQEIRKLKFFAFPDDQGWIAHKVPNAAGWKVGSETGIYVYQKPGWPGGKSEQRLPADARLVTFINRDPKNLVHLDWVRENWR